MERIDCAYEMLSDPALLSLLHGSITHVPCSPNVECVLQRKQVSWIEWPEGTFFPQWRPPPPGARPPKPEHDAPQGDPLSQEYSRICESRWETPIHLHQPRRNQNNPAPLSTQWPEPPWPWLKQRPRNWKLDVEEVSEDERRVSWRRHLNNFFVKHHTIPLDEGRDNGKPSTIKGYTICPSTWRHPSPHASP
jgi:hypothetical protein